MAVYIDGEAVTLEATHLGGLLDQARRQLDGSGRIIVEVSIDGRVLAGNDLDEQRGLPVGGTDVRLASADPRELAVQALDQVRARLDGARVAQLAAADLFQRDRAAEAMQELAKAVEAWQQTRQTVVFTTSLLGIDLERKSFEGQPVAAVVNTLIVRLTALRDMISASDTVGLADALEFEWSEIVEQWQRLLDQILAWVGDEGAKFKV